MRIISKPLKDLTDMEFGRLKVIKQYEYRNKFNQVLWVCMCNCKDNNIVYLTSGALQSGNTKSCGCLTKEIQYNKLKKYNTYDLSGEYGIGWTSNTNEEFYFDLEDYDKIKDYCWKINSDGYLNSNTFRTTILMHRLLTDCDKYHVPDHKNHNKLDNRKLNLRISTYSNNAMNRKLQSNNTSGVTGVYFNDKKSMWIAHIGYQREKIMLGSYYNFEDAVKARKDAEEKYFGAYSYKNSIMEGNL